MKTKIYKFLGVALTLMLLGSLTVGLGVPVAAADGMWSTFATPQAGAAGGYILGPTTGVTAGPGPMEKNCDGSIIYAYFNVGEADNLYKSTDGASTWTRCSTGTDDLAGGVIVAIACSPEDPNRVYVTDGTWVYKSIDAGATFVKLVQPPAGAVITCLAVGYNGDHFVYINTGFVATVGDNIRMLRDVFGYLWETTDFDLALPLRNVRAIACSPKFATEAQPQVIAVSDDNATGQAFVSFSYANAAWAAVLGDDVEIQQENTLGLKVSFTAGVVCADIAFPGDYNSSRTLRDFFIGISAGGLTDGDVYRIIAATDIDLNVRGAAATNITSVACAGNAGSCKLLAAGTSVIDVFHSEDNGVSWVASIKDPVCTTATTPKYLIMEKNYATSGKALLAVNAAGALDGASFAQTSDFGVSWTDLSLINTNIARIYNVDVSSKYATDFTVFMVTGTSAATDSDSLWKWDGTSWMRVATIPFGTAATAIIQCSPDYFFDKTVFLADTANLKIYRSNDYGMWFKQQSSLTPTPFDGGMLVISASSILIGSGSNTAITRNNGTTWDVTAVPGTGPIVGLAKAPDYSSSKHLLCGDSAGNVFLSKDDGAIWAKVPAGVTAGSGATNVAFDSKYTGAAGGYVYAATAGDDRVRRLSLPAGTAWSTIDSPDRSGVINASSLVPGIQMAADGTMYVSSQSGTGTTTSGAADAFVLMDPIGGDSGSLVVSSGSVTVTTIGTATWAAPNWATLASGDGILVTATAAGTTGVWTQLLPGTGATVTVDTDGDAHAAVNFLPTGGTFSLPDAASSSTTSGTTQVVLRSLSSTRTYSERQSFGFSGTAANLRGVWCTAPNMIWTLESSSTAANNRIWTYTDKLTGLPTLLAPKDKENTGRLTTAALSWNAMATATAYEVRVQIGSTTGPYVAGTPAFVYGTSFAAAGLEDGTTYAWRVRSATVADGGKASSQWSATWTFSTGMGPAEWDPFIDPARVVPIPGSYDTPIRPTFMWNPADWATGYEFEVSKAADFSNPIWSFKGTTALKISAFVADKDLEYATNYYWSVTAISASTRSITAYGSFRTLNAPVAPTPPVTVASPTPAPVTVNLPPAEQIAPVWIWAIIAVGAVLVIAVIVLIITTRRVP